ncbi:cadmium-translocating P-type ATPase [Aliifodinibius salicampi]|uniref:P-type Zn(2+) transporter n=1 Tax=Fodinibius salicampi TaxID=1920655 RepID=A0ABT3Q139_9BACT|nr:heavy metal translocating P-type ATPase [Fodinibius salicampi]MCW9713795.1 cadmium-translocating P-type ATPase [Fodinibius salicampi]
MFSFINKYKEAVISAVLLAGALITEYGFSFDGRAYLYLPLYGLSYLSVGGPVWIKAFKSIQNGTIFSEFMLMGIATVGAFAIGEYAEGVAVMLFYMIGEYAQHGAVQRARGSVEALIDQQPEIATVERDGSTEQISPSEVEIGEIIRVKPGEKVPLDGELLTGEASFNTAALTGESKPISRHEGEEVWAGSINRDRPVRIRVTEAYENTQLSKILTMVREASQRKAPTQRFMTRFAKVYTPAVVWLAVALTFVPWLIVENYIFEEWLYRALIFLVVSCPCGLVISIPLGYFGGIGAASRNGILFKGSDFMDRLRNLDALFFDKTGTLTEGKFKVQDIHSFNGISNEGLLQLAAALEQQSTHPIGKAIVEQANGNTLPKVSDQQEVSGMGITGLVNNQRLAVGNKKLMQKEGIALPSSQHFNESYSLVHIGIDGKYAGSISIADQLKEDTQEAVHQLRELGIENLVMLSGDKQSVVDDIANQLNLKEAFGELLPDDKYRYLEQRLDPQKVIGYVGDGINDAPVITLADIGIAMGGMGSDATIETADVVIQTDQLSKIPTAINIANFTHRVIWQNIGFALGIKILVMTLAFFGLATMWEAIFADVGVALIAIANAIRIQHHFTDEKITYRTSVSANQNKESEELSCCQNC